MSTRLPAQERKAAVLDCACGIFQAGSYRGTTTAEIAREAGVTEPVLYRHFASKRALYLAVLEESWFRLRALWNAAVDEEPDPRFWVGAMGRAYFAAKDPKVMCADLLMLGLVEASVDVEIRRFLRKQMREVHDYVSDVIRRSQAAGGVYSERDPSAEAWIFISIGLLGTVGRRVGSLLENDFEAIIASRRAWMAGA
jgi:TetR/AcrR family transcriptional regulator